jgi:hypothetical protein
VPQLGPENAIGWRAGRESTPQALFVTMRLGAFTPLVLVHFQAAFFLEVTHGNKKLQPPPLRSRGLV